MNKDVIQALAKYFTGGSVAHNSIGLNISSMKPFANEFFDIRERLGIRGYANQEEAESAIASALEDK